MPHPRSHLIDPYAYLAEGQPLPDVDPRQMGLAPQDIINALYDVLGSYPRKNVLPYFYQLHRTAGDLQHPALTALQTVTDSIRVSADAGFICTYLMANSTGDFTAFLRTDSSDRQLMDDPVHSATLLGTAERPMILPKPLLLAPNTTVTWQLTDLSNDVNTIYLTMGGFKVYRRQYASAG